MTAKNTALNKPVSYAWVFGRFEGDVVISDDAVTVAAGQLSNAKFTSTAPAFSPQKELLQSSLSSGQLSFAQDNHYRDAKGKRYRLKQSSQQNLAFKDLIIRQYQIDNTVTEQGLTTGKITGIAWAKVGTGGYGGAAAGIYGSIMNIAWSYFGRMFWGLALLGLLVLLFSTWPWLPDSAGAQGNGGGDEVGDHIGCDENIEFQSDLLFSFNESTLKPGAYQELEQWLPFFSNAKEQRWLLQIVGHTDSFGSNTYNQRLSERRSAEVSQWFIGKEVIHAGQVVSTGRGESELIVARGNRKKQAPNRRVEVRLACTEDDLPIIYSPSAIEQPSVASNELKGKEDYISIEDALIEPEIFLQSCDKPILLSSDVIFDIDRSSLKVSAISELKLIASLLNQSADEHLTLKIVGHTDAKGSAGHNQRLSERRASRVARWLAGHTQLEARQLLIEGRGESDPVVAESASREKQAFNRRVEIMITCSSKIIEADSL